MRPARAAVESPPAAELRAVALAALAEACVLAFPVHLVLAQGHAVRVFDSLDPQAHDGAPSYLSPAAELVVTQPRLPCFGELLVQFLSLFLKQRWLHKVEIK